MDSMDISAHRISEHSSANVLKGTHKILVHSTNAKTNDLKKYTVLCITVKYPFKYKTELEKPTVSRTRCLPGSWDTRGKQILEYSLTKLTTLPLTSAGAFNCRSFRSFVIVVFYSKRHAMHGRIITLNWRSGGTFHHLRTFLDDKATVRHVHTT